MASDEQITPVAEAELPEIADEQTEQQPAAQGEVTEEPEAEDADDDDDSDEDETAAE